MKILMVSPYPPYRDGVGRYAEQEVEKLKADGHHVEVLSPLPSAAHHHADLKGALRMLRIRRYARGADRVILQYQPSHFHAKGRGFSRLLSNVGMLMTFLSVRDLWIICHEVEYPRKRYHLWMPDVIIERLAWRFAPHVVFHSTRELEAMRTSLGVTPRRASVRDPGESVTPAIFETKARARAILGIDQASTLLLCIGFIQPHKGFDRAVRAFAELDPPGATLVIAGSVRTDETSHRDHLEGLKAAAAGNPKIIVREAMLSDEEFDRWIVASDVLLLPYREIWSSAVLERAKLYDTKVIASRVGALPEQVRESDIIVDDDDQLRAALADVTHAPLDAGRPAAETELDYDSAVALLEETSRSRRKRGAATPNIEKALSRLRSSPELQAYFPVLPSGRPGIGPAITIVKKVLRRIFAWYLRPLLDQIRSRFESLADAAEAAQTEVQDLRIRVEELQAELGKLKDR